MLHTTVIQARYVLLVAWRTGFFSSFILLFSGLLGLSMFVGLLAITEQTELQLSLLAASLRLLSVYFLSVWLITHVLREFDDKSLFLLLALPIPRQGYLLGKCLGASGLALLCVGLSCLALLLYSDAWYSVMLWGITFACELFIMSTVSLLCALSFRHTTLALTASLGFYVLARSMQGFLNLGEHLLNPSSSGLDQGISGFLNLLALLLPSLDRFSNTAWLIYQPGSMNELFGVLLQTGVYVLLLLGVGFIDLARKNF